ncbi:MAG: DUF1294 domain-containing protein [Clostridia bacterium]|nr:DUF1294 domain-containing protein [Clostridia bacterium]
MVLKLVLLYLVIINICALLVYGLDKLKAKRSARRIPEKTLFALAFLGGGVGALCGMYVFRHKTQHKSFVYGIPAILLGEVFVIALILYLI